MIPVGLCQCGCGEKTTVAPQSSTKMGWVRGQPVRFVSGHNRKRSDADVLALIDAGGECWRWQGAKNDQGYGTIVRYGRRARAHRVIYELLVGPIPPGMELDHVRARGCRFTDCVNPAHLEPVTHRTNVLRGDATSAVNARKTHCPAGHVLREPNLSPAHLRRGKRVCRTCLRTWYRERYRLKGKRRKR